MVNHVYPPELIKADTPFNEAAFLDLSMYVSNGFVSSKIYDKCDDFDIVKFPSFGWERSRSSLLRSVYFSTCKIC